MMNITILTERTRKLQVRAIQEVRDGLLTADGAAASLADGMFILQEEDRPGAACNREVLLRSCRLIIDQALPNYQGLSLDRHFRN